MTDAEKEAARDLLKTGASDDGYTKAVTIMSLENILRDLEKNGANVRNPEWYFVSFSASRPRPASGAGESRAITCR